MSAKVDDTIPYEDVLQAWRSLAATCKKLRDANKLNSGFVFGIQEDGRIGAKPIPPVFDPKKEGPPDLPAMARNTLAAYQSVREALAKSFDLSSQEWNTSAIGQMVNYVEKELRGQV
jgi:hypothetical protein